MTINETQLHELLDISSRLFANGLKVRKEDYTTGQTMIYYAESLRKLGFEILDNEYEIFKKEVEKYDDRNAKNLL